MKEEKFEIKKDCFAYREKETSSGLLKQECNALNDLYCKKENCNFYKCKGGK